MTQTITTGNRIFVTSHVARDLQQNAALFRNEKLVVWEYVANGLEYIDEGISPVVKVTLDNRRKRIVVVDNGRGMDWNGLQNFFIMHGENIDRKTGRPGRGRFGTGKSAAFGIADLLRVTTVRNGKRSQVELSRDGIAAMKSEDPIPVQEIKCEVPTSQPNGTMIEIEGINLKSMNQAGVIQFIERHLARWRNATVFVNNRECEFAEPPIVGTRVFRPEDPLRHKIGDVELTIKIASAHLDEELRGVSIFSNRVWHETTLAGNEGREMSQYIFGEIDVPKLDGDESPIPPFDLSRSMRLNPSNELVQAIHAFIGQKIDEVRRDLLKAEKIRKATDDAKRLATQADAIARVINDDFDEFRERVARAKAKGGKGFDAGTVMKEGGADPDVLIFGSELPAVVVSPTGDPGSEGGTRTGGTEVRDLRPQVEPGPTKEDKKGRPAGGKDGRTASRGGFRVEFKPMKPEETRALYVGVERTIYINLDHPQLEAARGNKSIEDPLFLRLAYEVAFSEYAIALAHELNKSNEFLDTSDPIVSIRETINRIARKAAYFYTV